MCTHLLQFACFVDLEKIVTKVSGVCWLNISPQARGVSRTVAVRTLWSKVLAARADDSVLA